MKKYRRAIRKSPAKDPQQYTVYRMEGEAIGGRNYAHLTRRAINRFVRSLCREYNVPMLRIVFKDLGSWAAMYDTNTLTIEFNNKKATAQDLVTAAHEFAHHLHWTIAPDSDHQHHGPEFMACYLSVLDTARIVPVIGMRVICDHYKIKYNNPGDRSSLRALRKAVLG